MTRAAILATGAASALGLAELAYAVGAPGDALRSGLRPNPRGRLFGRVAACAADHADRPEALLSLGLAGVVQRLDSVRPNWRAGRVAAVIGTSSGGFAALERWLDPSVGSSRPGGQELLRKAAYFAPLSVVGSILGREPEQLVALYAACASSTVAIGLGLRWLELGYYDLVIVGGYDAKSELVCAGFDSLKATSAGVPRPFRAERDGMVLGEGVALLALSRDEPASVSPLELVEGYVEGFGTTTDALHVTAPDRTGAGLAAAAQLALDDAEVSPAAIDFVSVHATGTAFNDASEAQALIRVFGVTAATLTLHAFKPIVGHTLGAAGALEALSAINALNASVLPATLSPGEAMPELSARLLDHNQSYPTQRCLKLSTAFGGANAALVLSRGSSRPAHSRARAAQPVHLAAMGGAINELSLERLRPLLVGPVERLPRSDPLSLLAVAAAAEALLALETDGTALDRMRTGVVVGSICSTLEANAAFAERVHARGPEHAEPRRFPATSPNACVGHVAIAFGLKGPAHAVGAGSSAALEALLVAHDWIASGDADAMLVIAAEEPGETSRQVLRALGLSEVERGAYAVVLTAVPSLAGRLLDRDLLLAQAAESAETPGFRALAAVCARVGLPDPRGFGSVRPPE